MGTDHIDLVAIITPKKGQTERFLSLFAACAAHAEKSEPGTLRYRIHRGKRDETSGAEELVVRETYENAAALQTHLAGAHVKAMVGEIEAGTLTENVKIIHITPAAGYERARF
ncbi:predicted protein [Verticillium alfalfae VaMs.102]|uniref:Predicted protein n=1 Tax=Verticillium alfalfae (strain VaMs.102 / ATCC MYA-4576 / FGSC 10136) TaxID=526221 RepID=C9SVK6_VERA1|nr:predicted protein [Verticillium alfalfae VaMs.102]EEY22821.1 predicted protein [Verticillium alfalfae VaMs.102]